MLRRDQSQDFPYYSLVKVILFQEAHRVQNAVRMPKLERRAEQPRVMEFI